MEVRAWWLEDKRVPDVIILLFMWNVVSWDNARVWVRRVGRQVVRTGRDPKTYHRGNKGIRYPTNMHEIIFTNWQQTRSNSTWPCGDSCRRQNLAGPCAYNNILLLLSSHRFWSSIEGYRFISWSCSPLLFINLQWFFGLSSYENKIIFYMYLRQ